MFPGMLEEVAAVVVVQVWGYLLWEQRHTRNWGSTFCKGSHTLV